VFETLGVATRCDQFVRFTQVVVAVVHRKTVGLFGEKGADEVRIATKRLRYGSLDEKRPATI